MTFIDKRINYNMEYTLKNELNLVYFDKFNLKNIFSNNGFSCKVVLQFQLQNLFCIDANNSIIASFFLLRLFAGDFRKPYIFKLKCIQTFKKKNYIVIIRLDLNKLFEINNFFNYFSLSLLPKLSNDDYSVKDLNILNNSNDFTFDKRSKLYIRRYIIYNLNCIRIVETNSIFYKWKENLFIDIRISNSNMPVFLWKDKLKSDIFFLKLFK